MPQSASSMVKAVVFDWAGTTVDFGSCAPVSAFVEIFRRAGVEITEAEAREPMGRGKLDHIATITRMPRVEHAWKQVHRRIPDDDDVRRMYETFLPVQRDALASHADLIPGVIETVAWLRERGVGIGSTTGYTRALMEVLAPIAKASGYAPNNVVCIDDVPSGRPAPWMLLRSAEALDAYPTAAIVAVDDTSVGITAARHAGAISVGVALTGNALGLSRSAWEQMPADERAARRQAAYESLQSARADFVIDSVADLPQLFPAIEQLIATRLH